MIVRIVKMTFAEDKVADFLEMFNERKQQIRNFPGCTHLELWRQAQTANVYFTYSHWDNASALDHYRFSGFFKDTWSRTKALFAAKAEAWSVEQEAVLS